MIKRIRNYFFAGLAVLIPSVGSLYVFWLLFNFLDGFLSSLIAQIFGRPLPGLGFIVTIFFIFLVGYLTSNFLGRKILGFMDYVFFRVPLLRNVYSSFKQIVDSFMQQNKTAFKKVVMIEYPRKGLYVLGFLTGESRGEVQENTHSDTLNVFVPTSPNPTSGMLVLVPSQEVIFLKMSVEEGLKLIISGGVFSPENNL